MISLIQTYVFVYALSFTLTEHLVNFYIFMLSFLHLVNCFCIYIFIL